MSLANYVISKGIKSLETSLDDEEHKNTKITIITEELLYRKLLRQHQSIMFTLLFFHFLLLIIVFFKILFSPVLQENSYFCQNFNSLENFGYLILNLPLLLFTLKGYLRNTAILSNLQFYEKSLSLLVLGTITSFVMLFYKSIPDYICMNVSVSFESCLLMFLQLFCENFFLYLYTKWFQRQLRKFGALINQLNLAMYKPNAQFDEYIKNASFQELKHLDLLSKFSPANNDASYHIEEEDLISQLYSIQENFAYLDQDEKVFYQEIQEQRANGIYYSGCGGLTLGSLYFLISKDINKIRGSYFLRFFQSFIFGGMFATIFYQSYNRKVKNKIELLYLSVTKKKFFQNENSSNQYQTLKQISYQ